MIAHAPSNIALVKYMGKSSALSNLPANPSISLTLQGLCTWVELSPSDEMRWVPELPRAGSAGSELSVPDLDEKAIVRVSRQIALIRETARRDFPRMDLEFRDFAGFEFRTANAFPMSAGIASSASSMAALTLAASASFCDSQERFLEKYRAEDGELLRWVSSLSRQGSGSSIRSFEGPWVRWQGESAQAIPSELPPMADLVLVVDSGSKEVSSREAHARVTSSPLWGGRAERATERVDRMSVAIGEGDLDTVARLAWADSWEMHSLFHTSEPPFTYWTGKSVELLQWFSRRLEEPAPPVVTMDAGPNVHVLVPESRADYWEREITSAFPDLKILRDREGRGAGIL